MQRFASGFGLIDAIVGVGLLLVVFLALFGVLRASLMLSTLARAKAGAIAVAQVQIEYLRGLTYDEAGTIGGIPAGSVPQDATTTEDGIVYSTHTFISYIDDPADGLGANDENGITTDYKRARVEVSYTIGGQSHTVVLVSNLAPPGVESSNGGGTLEVDVVDATGAPVSGASVHIINASTNPATNVTTASNVLGRVYLPGAATSSAYQVAVSKGGYSSAQTYARDATNQNPNPGYLTVVKDQTTTQTFAIDRLSELDLTTYAPIATTTFSDSFADSSLLALTSSTTVSGGALSLDSGETSGFARSIATTSSYLAGWGDLSATMNVPSGASVLVHVYNGSGSLVPDSDLAGNSVGFSSFPVSLSGLSTTTYSSLAIGADFTGDGVDNPSITGWSLSFAVGPVPLPNVQFTLSGTKIIGSHGDGTPILKTIDNTATGDDGTQGSILEWDSYALTTPNYDVKDACPSPPYILAPGTTVNASLFLVSETANSLRVVVTDNAGAIVPGASVTLARIGYSKTVTSSSCGSAYFGGLASDSDYTVTIAKNGYTTTNSTGVSVSGPTVLGASFP